METNNETNPNEITPQTEEEIEIARQNEIENESQQTAEKIGEKLRNARVEKNIPLEIIMTELKISKEYLENFENGNYIELPETTYALGFLKAYAQYLNMESDEILSEFRIVLNSRGKSSVSIIGIQQAPTSRGKLYYIFAIAIIMCVILYSLWINYSQNGTLAQVNPELNEIANISHFYEHS